MSFLHRQEIFEKIGHSYYDFPTAEGSSLRYAKNSLKEKEL